MGIEALVGADKNPHDILQEDGNFVEIRWSNLALEQEEEVLSFEWDGVTKSNGILMSRKLEVFGEVSWRSSLFHKKKKSGREAKEFFSWKKYLFPNWVSFLLKDNRASLISKNFLEKVLE